MQNWFTYSIRAVDSEDCCLIRDNRRPILQYKRWFSASKVFCKSRRVRRLKWITGHREQPAVQQQHKRPQKSQRTWLGSEFSNRLLILRIVSWNSSGANFPCNSLGNSSLNLLFMPNLNWHYYSKGEIQRRREGINIMQFNRYWITTDFIISYTGHKKRADGVG